MKKLGITLLSLILIVLSGIGFSMNGHAADGRIESNDEVIITETTDGVLTVSGQTIVIEGDVNGPLFAAGQDIHITGDVNGPIFVAGNTITIEGAITGEAFLAGNTIRTTENANFNRDVFTAGNQISFASSIGRDLFVGSNSTHLQNQIGRNAFLSSNTLILGENGQISGDLTYQSEQEIENIEDSVQGEVQYREVSPQNEQEMDGRSLFSSVLSLLGAVLSATLIWLFLRRITQKRWITLAERFVRQPIRTNLLGLGLLLLAPFVIVLALLSNVFSNIGILIAILVALLVFFGKIVTASVIGKYLLKRWIPKIKHQSLLNFVIAYTLLVLAGYLPYIGWLIGLFSVFYTIGLAFREVINRFQTEAI